MWLILNLLNLFVFDGIKADDFPSLLSVNASLAVILDRDYLDTDYEKALNATKVFVEKVLREDFKNGGLIVSYYSWTKINLRKGFTGVLSIAGGYKNESLTLSYNS